MKRCIKFSKLYGVMIAVSAVIIASGVVGFFTRGINYGIDFQAGFIEKVRFAPTAFTVTYRGEKNVQLSQNGQGIDITVISIDTENKVYSFKYTDYTTIGTFVEGLKKLEGVAVDLRVDGSIPLRKVFVSTDLPRLSKEPFRVHFVDDNAPVIEADEVRYVLSSVPSASVQQIGDAKDRTFQIRLPDNGTYENANKELRTLIQNALVAGYGLDNFAVLGTDFVGSRFSGALARQAVLLVLGALVLIFLYALIRFRWNFALGAVLAIIHDVFIMLAVVVWTGMEFNSTTIAAILTIVGYSINDTVVVFDRIRESIRLNPKLLVVEVLDLAQTEVLTRTIITTVTTMLAVAALYIFTDGSMKNFAFALLVGMISGVYSTIYIAGACIVFSSGKKRAGEVVMGTKKRSVSGVVV